MSGSRGARCDGCGQVLPRWTTGRMIDAAHRWERERGRPPTVNDWMRSGPWWPAASGVVHRFGGWQRFLTEAGFTTRRRWTDGELLEVLVAWRDAHGRYPIPEDMRRRPGGPTDRTIQRRFGTWPKALREAERYRRELNRERRAATVDLDRLRPHLERWASLPGRSMTDIARAAGITNGAVFKVMSGRNGAQTRVTLDVADRMLVAIGRPDLLDEVAA